MALQSSLSKLFQSPKSEAESEEEIRSYNSHKQLISGLPIKNGLYNYRGFWFFEKTLLGALSCQKHFKSSPTDIFLCTYPKSGTTWIKALAFAILNRQSGDRHPLLSTHPQICAINLERTFGGTQVPDLSVLTDHPRLFASHLPYSLLPDNVKGCKIVHVCRDPKDTLISFWHFLNEIRGPEAPSLPLDRAVEDFCNGPFLHGPIWDHLLEYKRESLSRPETVLCLAYEEMKARPEDSARKLAKFLGKPFTEEEERDGVVGEIVRMCSFEFLKELEVNKEGLYTEVGEVKLKNSSFFRKGQVGDWKEHLSSEMAERIDQITQHKFGSLI